MKNRKNLISMLVLVVLIALTVMALFRGQNIGDIVSAMKHADPLYIFMGFVCVVIFLFGQGFIFRFLLAVLGQDTNIFKCISYSFKGYFFCSVTPFQIGGPPVQILYMKEDNIPVPVASMLVLIVATVYKVVLILLGIGLIIFGQGFMSEYLGMSVVIMGVGMFMTCGFCFILFMFMFHPRLAKKAIFKFFRWLERRHLMKHKYGREEKIEEGMSKYTQTADFFKGHGGAIVILLILTVLQRAALFAVTYCVYRAFGLSGEPVLKIIILQAVISLSVDMLPIPGGVGLSEAIFSNIFKKIFTAGTMLPALALSRGISYYGQLFICAGFIFVSKYAFRARRRKAENAESA
ncbi:MAG: lysylphosphatidylglycerol synthase transmembrane domain-containing protein [Candidatus Alectryocaccobium sp.]|nr:flippase-like domain-containing protein [Lachnospiraceae bacterium]MDY6222295.1 lysylphosphatidylglycerol synthase transmembrane domain-containing protein [Candidatus Alectryocaccobium sp.]